MTQEEKDTFRDYVRAEARSAKQHVRDYYNWLDAEQIKVWASA